MYRHRNRPKYTEAELVELYKHRYNHENWPDHVARVEKTIEIGLEFLRGVLARELDVVDLSCGDGAIVDGLAAGDARVHTAKGDFTPGYEFCGPIEATIEQIYFDVDLYVFSESIEHLDDPDAVLAQIRRKSDRLLMSTPKLSWPDPNPEHYWAFDDEAIREMLVVAGWTPVGYSELYTGLGYTYQIWTAI